MNSGPREGLNRAVLTATAGPRSQESVSSVPGFSRTSAAAGMASWRTYGPDRRREARDEVALIRAAPSVLTCLKLWRHAVLRR
jgi:hypothetical protein